MYIIRHLQTDWNRQGLLQGSNDIDILPIDEALQQQIDQQKQLLNDIGEFDHVMVSEMRRTQQTASAYGFERWKKEGLINELNFGQFEGRPRDELISSVGQIWFDDPRQVMLGESIVDLHKRISLFLHKYQDCQRLLVFGHGSWARAMLSFFECGDLRKMNQLQMLNNQLIKLSYQPTTINQLADEQTYQ